MDNTIQLLGSKKQASETSWINQELAGCEFSDERHKKRLRDLLGQLWSNMGETIPFACQDWANTKAAYRFFSNDRISEQEILQGHFQSTQTRFVKTKGPVLILQDTTVFSYKRERPELIGVTHRLPKQVKVALGEVQGLTMCGILMHASLAVTTQGLPFGLAAIKFWTRKKFKESNALKKRINPTRMPIEQKESYRWLENLKQSTALLNDPKRCVHIGDRESDIYELFHTAEALGTHFLVRTCVDRLAGDGGHTILDEMNEETVKGLHRVKVWDKKGVASKAVLTLKYRRICVLAPIGKQKQYPGLWLTVIHAEEKTKPKNRERIVWKLMTNLPVKSRKEVIEKLSWYALRWKIETFHKILKSGCKAELSKLRTAERLTNFISVLCILSWRIFWLTMLHRVLPSAPAKLVFNDIEIKVLDQLVKNNRGSPPKEKTLSHYLIQLAKLGGYLARASDLPPGNMVMWRGLSKLTDIEFGFNLAKNCG